jgi:hypothetical protein
MSGKIFISYRREDSSAAAGRIYDRLSGRFSSNRIFIDVDKIAPGVDFVTAIEQSIGSCDVLISVVGKRWLTATDEDQKRRLDDTDDFVRLEIATALKRGIRVIPVLVDGASMPRSGDLPDELKSLVRLQALKVSQDRFRSDSEPLIAAVEQALKQAGAERRRRGSDKKMWLRVAGVMTVMSLVVVAIFRPSCREATTPQKLLQSPAIAVRSYNAEVDVVVQGPNNSLRYYWATPPDYHQWQETTIAGNGTTFSSPAIAVESNGRAHVVVQGPNNSLQYYSATPGSPWPEYTSLVTRDCGGVEREGARCRAGTQQFPAVLFGHSGFSVV